MAAKKYKVLVDGLTVYSSILDPDYGYKMIKVLDQGTNIDVEEIVKGVDRDIAKMPGNEFVYSRWNTRNYIEPIKKTTKKKEDK